MRYPQLFSGSFVALFIIDNSPRNQRVTIDQKDVAAEAKATGSSQKRRMSCFGQSV
jgi:hypothetical protein